MLLDAIIAAAIVIGALFALIGSIGMVRFGDVYMRLHGPTKATTLGLGALLVASVLYFSRTGSWSLHEVLITAFLFLTAPVSAHMIARAGLALRVRSLAAPLEKEELDAFPETAGSREPSESDQSD
jgi:multicomponent K+:H+ antiporter subunit G